MSVAICAPLLPAIGPNSIDCVATLTGPIPNLNSAFRDIDPGWRQMPRWCCPFWRLDRQSPSPRRPTRRLDYVLSVRTELLGGGVYMYVLSTVVWDRRSDFLSAALSSGPGDVRAPGECQLIGPPPSQPWPDRRKGG